MPDLEKSAFAPGRFKVRQLVLLVHLDERRSVLAAAEAAHISQPAASKLLAQLEESVGAELFVRHGRGVEPTPYGNILIKHARNVLNELRHAHEELTALRSGLSGAVAIGTVIASATDVVPRAVAKLKQRYPGVSVSIEVDVSEPLLRRLHEGKLDIVIARLGPQSPEPHAFAFEWLKEPPHAIIARAGHPLGANRQLRWPDLVPQTWVLPPEGNVLRHQLTLLLLKEGLPFPSHVVETSSLPVTAGLLQESDMIAPLALRIVEPYVGTGSLRQLPIALPIQLGPAAIATRRAGGLAPAALLMLKELRRTARRSRCCSRTSNGS